jgi:bis(5'-nucleosyl)-tetraphosphatase (symmetrical)
MPTYAIGDVQGCFSPLMRLVQHIAFDPKVDRLWFVGDLVNRGPASLDVLRYVRNLEGAAITVLGNHDLYLIAASAGVVPIRPKDTFRDVLNAPDGPELIQWLRLQRLLYRADPFLMVHAGLLPQWNTKEASELAAEVESVLHGSQYAQLLGRLYVSPRRQWSAALSGMERLAAISTVLTRLRTCSPAGMMELDFSGPPSHAPPGFLPWFDVPGRRSQNATILCGHWAALGLHLTESVWALDSGCVWGHRLTAIRLEDKAVFQTACHGE